MTPDPVVYFFVLGILAGLARADLRLPTAIYEFVTMVLLLSIGMKGGVELGKQPIGELAGEIAVVLLLGTALTLLAFGILRWIGRIDRPNAGAIAAHYGSVSVGTYAVATGYLMQREIPYEPQLALFLVLLEVPGIVIGILLARGISAGSQWGAVAHEIFLGKGVLLLLGGLIIGWIAGPDGLSPIAPLFTDLFKGILALFLLEMGLIASEHLSGFRQRGVFMLAFAIVTPVLFAAIGSLVALMLGLSIGGTVLLAALAASASYIAAPAALRTAVPEANPGLSLTAALGITFPFNILIGIPIYERLSVWLHEYL